LLAGRGALRGPLGLHQHQRLAVIAPQHVVDEALVLGVRHADHLDLEVLRRVQRPAGLLHQQVDEGLARLGFGVVVRVGLRAVRLLGGGHFFAQLLQLGVERRLAGKHIGQLLVFLVQLRGQLLQLLRRLRRGWRGGLG
jgi:hypothetical protein